MPVGNMEMCQAAIHNGADAIYVGAPGFNARGRTKDHGFEELKEIIDLCHLYGVKVHLAFNVLIFENEMEQMPEYIKKLLALGPDALIVQDLGLANLVREMAPWQTLHASTQMTITNELAIDEVSDLGFERYVLGRECSIPEIKIIREHTDKELEVFVHGALCVAYSGQCFTSEAIGGRSANRGQCAQSCRLDYELIVDGVKTTTHKGPYAVSPQDLMGLAEVPTLQEIGVESFKVEGRLKGPDYVASVGRHYKSVMDAGFVSDLETRRSELARTFSRGFYSGWLHGVEHQKLVDGSYSNHRGEKLGKVIAIEKRSIIIDSKKTILNGSGVLFASKKEIGSFVYASKLTNRGMALEFSKDFDLTKISVGDQVFLNKDPALERELAKSVSDKELQKRIPLTIKAKLKLGSPICLSVSDGSHEVKIESESILEAAKQKGASKSDIEKGLAGLGGSPFKLKSIAIELDENLFVPNQMLKNLRREFCEKLIALRTRVDIGEFKDFHLTTNSASEIDPKTNILLRSKTQLDQFIKGLDQVKEFDQTMVGTITLDYEFGKDYAESLKILKSNGFKTTIATTRILKPKELHHLKVIERLAPDEVLVRNLGALHFFKQAGMSMAGDFSLNVTNSLSAKYLMDKGLSRITMGLDLNQWQVDDMLANANGNWFEVIVHQHMPEFHMEHCVFAAYLSKGSSFKDCGKPCEKHKVSLKDMYGNIHHLAADQECRNTMFKAEAQAATSQVQTWQRNGVANFRIEGLWEDGASILKKATIFQKLLNEVISSRDALDELGMMEKFGVSAGVLSQKDTYQDRKKQL